MDETMTNATLEIPELVGKRNLRITESAMILGLGRSKVYELIAAGRLRSIKLDNARRIPVSAITEFLATVDGSGEVATA